MQRHNNRCRKKKPSQNLSLDLPYYAAILIPQSHSPLKLLYVSTKSPFMDFWSCTHSIRSDQQLLNSTQILLLVCVVRHAWHTQEMAFIVFRSIQNQWNPKTQRFYSAPVFLVFFFHVKFVFVHWQFVCCKKSKE